MFVCACAHDCVTRLKGACKVCITHMLISNSIPPIARHATARHVTHPELQITLLCRSLFALNVSLKCNHKRSASIDAILTTNENTHTENDQVEIASATFIMINGASVSSNAM